jgi:epoxyqueuosine reductase
VTAREAVRELARDVGFDVTRVADARPLDGAATAMRARLDDGHLDGMKWITAERIARATDPASLLEGARSFVVMAASYWDDVPRPPTDPGNPRGRVARYAWGRDYHDVLRDAANEVAIGLSKIAGRPVRTRTFVDSSPLAERAVAIRAGLGWAGKSTMVLSPGIGTYTLLATILTDLEIEPDAPLAKSCGACTRCIDSCPTGALVAPGILDARTCVSFHTIENRGLIPMHLRPAIGEWLFGCDDCQDSCPVNRRPARGRLADLRASTPDDAWPALMPILAMDETEFRARYRRSAIWRTKRRGLQRNACIVLGNLGNPAAVPMLTAIVLDAGADPVVRGHAAWALGQIGGAAARGALHRFTRVERRAHVPADDMVVVEVTAAIEACA